MRFLTISDNNGRSQEVQIKRRNWNENRCKLGSPLSYHITLEEESQILNEYVNEKLSCRKIAKLHHRDHTTVSRLLKKNNINVKSSLEISRKYFFNESYFENIDCCKKSILAWMDYVRWLY